MRTRPTTRPTTRPPNANDENEADDKAGDNATKNYDEYANDEYNYSAYCCHLHPSAPALFKNTQ